MRIVLDGMTAYRFWMSSLSPSDPSYEQSNNPTLSTLSGSNARLLAAGLNREGPSSDPLELLVNKKSDRRNVDGLLCRAWGERYLLPKGSLCSVGDGIYVVSPEFCMVRLAMTVSRIALLRCMTDLLGIYVMSYSNHMTLIERTPLTDIRSTRAYLERLGNAPGSIKVKRALNWVVERSASPRETSLDLLMRMPSRIGGQGLTPFRANYEITLSEEAQRLAGRTYLVGDAVWLDEKTDEVLLVLEYNSDEEHATLDRKIIDLEKITALQRQGQPVIPVTTRQFSQYETFCSIMQTVRERLSLRDRCHDSVEQKRHATYLEVLREEEKAREYSSLSEKGMWRYLLPRLG